LFSLLPALLKTTNLSSYIEHQKKKMSTFFSLSWIFDIDHGFFGKNRKEFSKNAKVKIHSCPAPCSNQGTPPKEIRPG